MRARAKRYESRLGVATDAVLYLVPGFIVFLFVPAAVLLAVEDGWSFIDSFYFAFITLTTIGFGDYVAGEWAVFWGAFGLGIAVVEGLLRLLLLSLSLPPLQILLLLLLRLLLL